MGLRECTEVIEERSLVSAALAVGPNGRRVHASPLPETHVRVEFPMNEKPMLLDQVAVQKLDRNGRWYVLPVEQIAYAFLGSAAALRYIHAASLHDARLETENVYMRTVRGVTVRTAFRQFAELEARLDQRHFALVNRALVANVRRLTELDLKGKIKQVGIAVGDDTEWLTVRHRLIELLLLRLGFCKRRPAPIAVGPDPRGGQGQNG